MDSNSIEVSLENTFISTVSFLNQNYEPVATNEICQIVINNGRMAIFKPISIQIDFYVKFDNDTDDARLISESLYNYYKKKTLEKLSSEIISLDKKNDHESKCLLEINKYDELYYNMNDYIDTGNNLFTLKHQITINNGNIYTLKVFNYSLCKFLFEQINRGKLYINYKPYDAKILMVSNVYYKSTPLASPLGLNIKDYLLNQITGKITPSENFNKIITVSDENKTMSEYINTSVSYIIFHSNSILTDFNDNPTGLEFDDNLMDNIDPIPINKKLYYNNKTFGIKQGDTKNIDIYNINNITCFSKMVTTRKLRRYPRSKKEEKRPDDYERDKNGDAILYVLPPCDTPVQEKKKEEVEEVKKVKKIEKIHKNHSINEYCVKGYVLQDKKEECDSKNKKRKRPNEKDNKIVKKQKTIGSYFK
jgi:hypothetical protein